MSKNCINLKDYTPDKRVNTEANKTNSKGNKVKLINNQPKDNETTFFSKKHLY